jgi:type II secretory pathway pseudopilin PulG
VSVLVGLRRALRRRREQAGDGGWTLIELMIAMVVTALALTVALPVLVSVNYVVNSGTSSSNAAAQARNGLRQLTTDITSANANNVCIPSAPTTMAVCPSGGIASGTGSTLRVLTNLNNVCKWVQWQVTSGTLTQESWPATSITGAVTATPVPVVNGVVNNSSTQPVFTLTGSTSYVAIWLVVRGSTGTAAALPTTANTSAYTGSQTVTLQTSASVLPASAATPSGAC